MAPFINRIRYFFEFLGGHVLIDHRDGRRFKIVGDVGRVGKLVKIIAVPQLADQFDDFVAITPWIKAIDGRASQYERNIRKTVIFTRLPPFNQ